MPYRDSAVLPGSIAIVDVWVVRVSMWLREPILDRARRPTIRELALVLDCRALLATLAQLFYLSGQHGVLECELRYALQVRLIARL